MKKKLLSVVLCAAMAVSMLVGCGNGGESGKCGGYITCFVHIHRGLE